LAIRKKISYDGRIIFDHLPKTAGQAVNSWLVKSIGSGCVTPNLLGQHRHLIRRYGGDYSVIFAHLRFEGYGLDTRYQYITCFREPIDRAISWLYFVLKNHESNQLSDLWELSMLFVDSEGEHIGKDLRPFISNPYVEHFAGAMTSTMRSDEQKLEDALIVIEKYDVVGFYENMPLFLSDVASLIGIPTPEQIERVNVTRTRPQVNEITPKFRKRLEELNALDIELYRIVYERWREKQNVKSIETVSNSSLWVPYNPIRERVFISNDFTLISAFLDGGDTFTHGSSLFFHVTFSLTCAVEELEIGIHIFDEDARWVFGTNTTLLERPLRSISSGTHTISYYLPADLPEGHYTAGFAFVERGETEMRELAWFEKVVTFQVTLLRLTSGVGYVNLPVEVILSKTGDTVIRRVEDARGTLFCESVLGDMATGETVDLAIKLQNSSLQEWVSTAYNPINLTYRCFDMFGNLVILEGDRTPLLVNQVNPGQLMDARMRIVAPEMPGNYRFMLMPVQESHCWFDEKGFITKEIEVRVVLKNAKRLFPAGDMRLQTEVGKRDDNGAILSTGREGHLLFGPYASFEAGQYRVRIDGVCRGTDTWLDIVYEAGTNRSAFLQLVDRQDGVIGELVFMLDLPVADLEVRLWVSAETVARIDFVVFEPV